MSAELVVPDDVIAEWQSLVDIMARIIGIPAGLIMRVGEVDIEVLLSSKTEGNPYEAVRAHIHIPAKRVREHYKQVVAEHDKQADSQPHGRRGTSRLNSQRYTKQDKGNAR